MEKKKSFPSVGITEQNLQHSVLRNQRKCQKEYEIENPNITAVYLFTEKLNAIKFYAINSLKDKFTCQGSKWKCFIKQKWNITFRKTFTIIILKLQNNNIKY